MSFNNGYKPQKQKRKFVRGGYKVSTTKKMEKEEKEKSTGFIMGNVAVKRTKEYPSDVLRSAEKNETNSVQTYFPCNTANRGKYEQYEKAMFKVANKLPKLDYCVTRTYECEHRFRKELEKLEHSARLRGISHDKVSGYEEKLIYDHGAWTWGHEMERQEQVESSDDGEDIIILDNFRMLHIIRPKITHRKYDLCRYIAVYGTVSISGINGDVWVCRGNDIIKIGKDGNILCCKVDHCTAPKPFLFKFEGSPYIAITEQIIDIDGVNCLDKYYNMGLKVVKVDSDYEYVTWGTYLLRFVSMNGTSMGAKVVGAGWIHDGSDFQQIECYMGIEHENLREKVASFIVPFNIYGWAQCKDFFAFHNSDGGRVVVYNRKVEQVFDIMINACIRSVSFWNGMLDIYCMGIKAMETKILPLSELQRVDKKPQRGKIDQIISLDSDKNIHSFKSIVPGFLPGDWKLLDYKGVSLMVYDSHMYCWKMSHWSRETHFAATRRDRAVIKTLFMMYCKNVSTIHSIGLPVLEYIFSILVTVPLPEE